MGWMSAMPLPYWALIFYAKILGLQREGNIMWHQKIITNGILLPSLENMRSAKKLKRGNYNRLTCSLCHPRICLAKLFFRKLLYLLYKMELKFTNDIIQLDFMEYRFLKNYNLISSISNLIFRSIWEGGSIIWAILPPWRFCVHYCYQSPRLMNLLYQILPEEEELNDLPISVDRYCFWLSRSSRWSKRWSEDFQPRWSRWPATWTLAAYVQNQSLNNNE